MKTKEELTQLKQEYESLATKLQELTEDELKKVAGGHYYNIPVGGNGPVNPDDSCPLCERCADCFWYNTNSTMGTLCSKPRKG